MPCPERGNAGMKRGSRSIERETHFVGLIAGPDGQMNDALSSRRDSPEDEQGLPEKEIWQALRINFCQLDSFKRQIHVSEHRTFDGFEQPSHLLANLADVRDMNETAASELRHLGGKKEIRSTADGHGGEARVSRILAQRSENLLFIAKVAVRQQDDVPDIAGSSRLAHHVEQRRQHLRAAAGFEPSDVAAPRLNVF